MKKGILLLKKPFIISLLLLLPLVIFSQNTITGFVSDAKDGFGLPGVTIVIKGTSMGTVTDVNGDYSIKASPENTLVFSFVGYETKEISVGSNLVLNVSLSESSQELEELVVIGYGVQKKSDRTGAMASVDSEDLNKGLLSDPIQGLVGKVAGVTVNKKGGDPNSGFSVKVRGSAGFFSGTSPLFVVDGVPGVDPTTIASEDIESFNILKDASATAIYGSRASNGVVMITTKKGTAGKPILEYSNNIAFENVARKLEFLTADEYRDLAARQGLTLSDGGANTDWQDVIYRTGIAQSHNLSAAGGTEQSTYRLAVTHFNHDGVVTGTSKQRTIGRLNITQKAIENRLLLQANISSTVENNDYIDYSGSGPNDVLYQMFQRNPTDPVYNEDGSFYEIDRDFNYYNPLALIEQIQNERQAKRLNGSLRADFEVLKGLKAGVNLGYVRNDHENFYFEPTFFRGGTTSGYGSRKYDNFESKVLETTLSYDKSISEIHNLNLVAGYSYQKDLFDGFNAGGRSPQSDFVLSNNIGVLLDVVPGRDIGSFKGTNTLVSFFGRAVYNYQSKYYLTATLRRDGSSKFGINNKWGTFPSASIAWNIGQEDFMDDLDWISQLKIRTGYGLVGNQEIDGYWGILYYSNAGITVNPENGADAIGFNRSWNSNPNIKWEENSELNIGVDYGFLANRFTGSIDYYNKKTYDLLAPYFVPVPPNAVNTTWANVGTIRNEGIEASLQAFLISNPEFKWKSNLTFSRNVQSVESLSGFGFEWSPSSIREGWLSGRGLVGDQNWTQIVSPGYALGTFFMPEYAGLSADGKFLFYTAAGGVTRFVNQAERRVVGTAQPDFELGWSNDLNYKNWDLGFALRAVVGGDVLNVTRMVFSNPTILPSLNALAEVKDEIERGLTDAPKVNSYYLEDATFVRLEHITLGYNFNVSNLGWISKFRVYFSGNNLLLLTGYSGLDPEITYDGRSFGLDQYNVYPKTKAYTFGLTATF